MRFPVAPFLSCISSTLVFACSDDIIAPFSASDTDPSAGTESPTTSEGPPTTGDPTEGEPVCEPNYPLPVAEFDMVSEGLEFVIPSRDCDTLSLVGTGEYQLDPLNDIFEVAIYRPAVSLGEWPNFRLPYVVFSPGNNQYSVDPNNLAPYYEPLFEALTSVGFVVFAIQPPNSFYGANWTVGKRTRALACTALWAFSRWSEAENSRLNCDFVVAGHSRGGEAAYHLAQNISGSLNLLGYEGRVLRGVLALAPRSKTTAEAVYVDDEGTSPEDGAQTVPYLILHGASDSDTTNAPTRAFEIYGDEEATPFTKNDKFLLWAHSLDHSEWGGSGAPTSRASAIISYYVPAWMRWQFLANGDPEDRQAFTDLIYYDRSAVSLDSSLSGSGFWDSCDPEFDDLDGPVIFADFLPGNKTDAAVRLQVDNMSRDSPTPCMSSISPSSSSESVSLTGFGTGQVCMGASEELIKPYPMSSKDAPHRATSAMRVQWGDADPGGTIVWDVDADLSDYSFLTLRVGQVNHFSPHTMTSIDVGIFAPVGMSTVSVFESVDLYTQDDFLPGMGVTSRAIDFMRTVRIPLSEFCAQGADITQVESVVISFNNDVDSRTVLLDSIEFTKALDVEDDGQCL
ncbi:MAG TPA: hypothetical protein PKL10_15615 [Nitrospira sp.]|nr:hypothetical protein [Nitrospira sp.]HNO35892.1 hypothetical protein [Nitrospira sp.]